MIEEKIKVVGTKIYYDNFFVAVVDEKTNPGAAKDFVNLIVKYNLKSDAKIEELEAEIERLEIINDNLKDEIFELERRIAHEHENE